MTKKRRKSALKQLATSFKRLSRSARFEKYYLIAALIILGVTTVFWATVGASVESGNADQLANTFLLDSQASADGMLLPAQHTFLLKIPLFWLVALFGSEPFAFTVATVLLCLITVGTLAFIISRIERRRFVLGTLLLALSAVLLFIPAQSYPGSLLPLNWAMLTTRNIEYLLFTGIVILCVRARRILAPGVIVAAAGAGLLIASDRLFVSLGAGTAILGGVIFILLRRRDLLPVAVRMLIVMIAGYIVAALLLLAMKAAGVHIDDGAPLGPYGFTQGPKNLLIAVVYAGLDVFTNLGANPAFDAVVIKDIPITFVHGLLSPAGLGYVVTIPLALVIVRSAVRLLKSVRTTILSKRPPRKGSLPSWPPVLGVIMIAASVTSLGLFVVSNHYYPADARYLGILLPTGFIVLAGIYSTRRFSPVRVGYVALMLVVTILFGIIFQIQNSIAQQRALGEITSRNAIVAAALKSHPVGTLAGNYWRVLPIRLGSPTVNVTPLQDCTVPRQVLSSRAWQPDLHTTGFAYILRLDGGLAGFPACTIAQVTGTYGRPDSSVVVAGTRVDPKEVLLFYDEGIHFPKKAPTDVLTDTVKPISVDSMPFTTCAGKTVMQFVAHEDDDILFMNPDLTHSIDNGDCIRTVFFTAGDAGSDKLYWLGRQHGAEEAYNSILGTPGAPWTERIVSVDDSHTITVANPRGNHAISLIFLHLPDGNPEGTGFASEGYQSLRKLYTRSIPAISPVDDGNENYTYGDLTSALSHLMDVYKPAEIRSQSTFSGTTIKDHSDHNAVGEFTSLAFKAYNQSNPDSFVTYYLGYPVHTMPPNVESDDYDKKVATFLTFGRFDGGTCHTLAECNSGSAYGFYLSRQYTYPY